MQVDCSELTVDDQLALASALSEALEGRTFALVKDETIVFDTLHPPEPQSAEVEAVVKKFISSRKDSKYYSTEWDGSTLVVHSADPLARSQGRRDSGQLLPPNLLKCPYASCGFVSPYPEVMHNHILVHGI